MSWTFVLRRRRSFLPSLTRSSPSSAMVPLLACSRPTISRPIVVLPQPDSPTMPNVLPGWIEKLTLATALTSPTLRCSTAPDVTGKFFTR